MARPLHRTATAMTSVPRAAVVLSLVSWAGAVVASLATLVWSGAFPDPPSAPELNRALAEARGWSAVTLGLVLPLSAVSLRATLRGSLRGRLCWLGTLVYLVYTYLEFAVSPPFTPLYLVYVVTFGCAVPALLAGAASVDTGEVARSIDVRVPRRGIAAFALVSSGVLALAWLSAIVTQSAQGRFGWPEGEAAIGHVVHALDLGLLVPLGVAAGVLLLRKRPAGYVVAALMLVNAMCMGAALTAMVAATSLFAGQGLLSAVPFALVPALAALFALGLFRAFGSDANPPASGEPLSVRAGAV